MSGPTSFDRFADKINEFTSKAWFFAACLLVVIVWAPSFLLFSFDVYQLLINTTTTIVTFLLVALQQNNTSRSDSAIQQKLNALASGVADLLDQTDAGEATELRHAVGLEDRESSA